MRHTISFLKHFLAHISIIIVKSSIEMLDNAEEILKREFKFITVNNTLLIHNINMNMITEEITNP